MRAIGRGKLIKIGVFAFAAVDCIGIYAAHRQLTTPVPESALVQESLAATQLPREHLADLPDLPRREVRDGEIANSTLPVADSNALAPQVLKLGQGGDARTMVPATKHAAKPTRLSSRIARTRNNPSFSSAFLSEVWEPAAPIDLGTEPSVSAEQLQEMELLLPGVLNDHLAGSGGRAVLPTPENPFPTTEGAAATGVGDAKTFAPLPTTSSSLPAA